MSHVPARTSCGAESSISSPPTRRSRSRNRVLRDDVDPIRPFYPPKTQRSLDRWSSVTLTSPFFDATTRPVSATSPTAPEGKWSRSLTGDLKEEGRHYLVRLTTPRLGHGRLRDSAASAARDSSFHCGRLAARPHAHLGSRASSGFSGKLAKVRGRAQRRSVATRVPDRLHTRPDRALGSLRPPRSRSRTGCHLTVGRPLRLPHEPTSRTSVNPAYHDCFAGPTFAAPRQRRRYESRAIALSSISTKDLVGHVNQASPGYRLAPDG